MTTVLASITPQLRKLPCVAHALSVREAWSSGNFRRFFILYSEAPNMGGYLMDKFAPRERLLALKKIIKAYVLYLCSCLVYCIAPQPRYHRVLNQKP